MKWIIVLLTGFATSVVSYPAVAQAPSLKIIEDRAPKKIAPKTLAQLQEYGKKLARQKIKKVGWNHTEWKALLRLWTRESQWNPHSKNKHSSAYGVPQILKMPVGTPIEEQIDLGIKYIIHRYKTPSRALKFHLRHGWY